MNPLLIALAGNPNSGKTSLFNAITGSKQHVGNWPGKTIAKKEGEFQHRGYDIKIVDLPGIYSMSAFSPEEVIARDFIVQEKPDIVITVLDAANLERNLYLAVQVLEMNVPVVIALNMSDIAEAKNIQIEREGLSQALSVPVIRTVARKEEGTRDLIDAIVDTANQTLL
ncbi:MAG: 50S ribosome-binding GTPase [Anaerolineales bacterium]|nr:50S ribosome-binding GTPase [Chloroflexota bacterium]MBL6980415.1 50S ribosome-binding GTPase [Anaerolineales bacterium]